MEQNCVTYKYLTPLRYAYTKIRSKWRYFRINGMKRLSIVISDEAFQVLKEYQEKKKISTRDEAMATLLLEFKEMIEDPLYLAKPLGTAEKK